MNVQLLMDSIAGVDAADALPCKLTLEDWNLLAPYLSVRFLKPGDPLMQEGEGHRELFILAEGELEVSARGAHIATLSPGTVVGEGSFFSGQPRSATVTPTRPGVAWGLTWDKFEAMARKQPTLAVELVKGLAVVLAVRMRASILVGQFT